MNGGKFPGFALAVSALFFAAGVAACGFFVGEGISGRSSGARLITVKGLSEKEVPASIAIWNVCYSVSGNDLGLINTKLAESTKTVTAFLKGAGFDEKEISVQPASRTDAYMQKRDKDTPPPPERYSASQTVLLRTAKVDLIKPALASVSGLMAAGVQFSGDSLPSYIFNQINEVKPGMIEEATKNARIAAGQFASDSQTSLGKLHSASQGWFQVENRDDATPERKVVRVIVDVQYEVK